MTTISEVTIQEVLSPLFIMCYIMGLGTYSVKEPMSKIRWIAYLSALYGLIIWLVYGYLLYCTITIFTLKVIFDNIATTVVVMLNIFTSITSAVVSLYYQKKFEIYMKKLAAVDDTLEKLGTPKIYRKMHMWSKCVVIGWIVYIFVIDVYSILWWHSRKKYLPLFICCIIAHPIHINTLMDFLIIFILRYIGTRFDKVNEHLRCLLMKEKHELRSTWKKPVLFHQYGLRNNNYKRILWTSMHLHLELCHITRELNWMFGIQIVFESVAILLYVTAMCYYCFIIVTFMQTNQDDTQIYSLFGLAIWIFIFLIRFYSVNYICESVMIKANKIHKIIHQLTSTLRYVDVWKEIHQFTLQTMQRPLKFTGMGLFYLGNECLRKV